MKQEWVSLNKEAHFYVIKLKRIAAVLFGILNEVVYFCKKKNRKLKELSRTFSIGKLISFFQFRDIALVANGGPRPTGYA
ncbi:hypothetical protein LJC44_02795 [Parabacteroides sp. OttesenSCG-928-G06]|nr:hypothetical protein [Parabacteroides sp. OttesenSCG-928-K15]MDL2282029.1 hypothetical protein [Parabacteroides sp. OttesenSCG-928-G06]